jgi:PTS system nitrogen regulatory IIA component
VLAFVFFFPWIFKYMDLTELIAPKAILPSLKATNKKQALQDLCTHAGQLSGLPARELFDGLLQRERLGSTGIGEGVAIPHGKFAKVPVIFGVFARPEKPLDFESIDGVPVDLIFLLIAPESAGADHLKALARLARIMRDRTLTAKLRSTRDPAALYALLTQTPASRAA